MSSACSSIRWRMSGCVCLRDASPTAPSAWGNGAYLAACLYRAVSDPRRTLPTALVLARVKTRVPSLENRENRVPGIGARYSYVEVIAASAFLSRSMLIDSHRSLGSASPAAKRVGLASSISKQSSIDCGAICLTLTRCMGINLGRVSARFRG